MRSLEKPTPEPIYFANENPQGPNAAKYCALAALFPTGELLRLTPDAVEYAREAYRKNREDFRSAHTAWGRARRARRLARIALAIGFIALGFVIGNLSGCCSGTCGQSRGGRAALEAAPTLQPGYYVSDGCRAHFAAGMDTGVLVPDPCGDGAIRVPPGAVAAWGVPVEIEIDETF